MRKTNGASAMGMGAACVLTVLPLPCKAQVTTAYLYDAQGQLAAVSRPTGAVTYGYDAAGNRTALDVSTSGQAAAASRNTSLRTEANSASAPSAAAVLTGAAYDAPSTIALAPGGAYTGLALASQAIHGSVTISETTATYTPAAGYSGRDSFTYTASGPGGVSAPATVTVVVAAPPVALLGRTGAQ